MAVEIQYVAVTIEPMSWATPNGGEFRELRVTVKTQDGQRHQFSKALRPDDLESAFDVIWRIAGESLKEEMRKSAVTGAGVG